jgi:hypothetical protein
MPHIEEQDNVADVTAEELTKLSTEEKSDVSITPTQIPAEFTVIQAVRFIGDHYNRSFKNVRMNVPHQLVDGGVIEFLDADQELLVATARLRLKNAVSVDDKTGLMSIPALLSDLSFKRDGLNITINKQ